MSEEFAEDAAAVLAAAGHPRPGAPGVHAHPAGGLPGGAARRRGGGDGHRQPQPARVQRLQGVLGQRRADHPARTTRASPRPSPGWARPREMPLLDRGARPRRRACGATSGPELDEAYLEGVLGLRLHPGEGLDLLHRLHRRCTGWAARWRWRPCGAPASAAVHPVPEQLQPDPAFPTVRFPNPEEPGAMDLSARARRAGDGRPGAGQRPRRGPAGGADPRTPAGDAPGAHRQRGGRAARPLPADPGPAAGAAAGDHHHRQLGAAGGDGAPAGRALRRDAHRLQVDRQPRAGTCSDRRCRIRLRLRGGARLHRRDPGSRQGRDRRGAGGGRPGGLGAVSGDHGARLPRGDPEGVRRVPLGAEELHPPRRHRARRPSPR